MEANVDPATALTIAGIGLLGVLIGGLITFGANYFLTVRKERADRERERRAKEVELMTAARMVSEETRPYYVGMVSAGDNPDYPLPAERKTAAWKKYSPILAANLQYMEWFQVVDSIYLWNAKDAPTISQTNQEYAKRVRASLELGMQALHPYIMGQDVPASPMKPRV